MDAKVIIVGGGQAGLAMSQALNKRNVDQLVLDAAAEPGGSWRGRYDSLVLFTPAQYSGLPGMPFPAPDDTYPAKDAVANYLAEYERRFKLPVTRPVRVTRITAGGAHRFEVDTSAGAASADHVVIATGALPNAWRPSFASDLNQSVQQLHSAEYRNPDLIRPGRVLVVGAGNSGAQIAVELASTHDVTIAFERAPKQLPQRLLGKDLFWWLLRLGVLDKKSRPGMPASAVGSIPLIGSDLRRLIRSGRLRRAHRVISADHSSVLFADDERAAFDVVIWATGFRANYDWIALPAFDSEGRPEQARGVSSVNGLYFIGQPGLHTKGSGFLGFVGRDAAFLGGEIATSVRAAAPVVMRPDTALLLKETGS